MNGWRFSTAPLSSSVRITFYQSLVAGNRGTGADCAFDTMNAIIVTFPLRFTVCPLIALIRRTAISQFASANLNPTRLEYRVERITRLVEEQWTPFSPSRYAFTTRFQPWPPACCSRRVSSCLSWNKAWEKLGQTGIAYRSQKLSVISYTYVYVRTCGCFKVVQSRLYTRAD